MGNKSQCSLLIDSLKNGDPIDLVPQLPRDRQLTNEIATAWTKVHNIDADLIRKALRGELLPLSECDPTGLRLRGVRIIGRLELESIDSKLPISFEACHLTLGMNAKSANLQDLTFKHCLVDGEDKEHSAGAICLENANIRGSLVLAGTLASSPCGPVLQADGITVQKDVILDAKFHALGASRLGTVLLRGAKIGRNLSMDGAVLKNDNGPAIMADQIIVEGEMSLSKTFSADGNSDQGTVRLTGAHIGSNLQLHESRITNQHGPAISADRIVVTGKAVLNAGMTAIGNGPLGALRITGGQVNHQITFRGSTITNTSGPAVVAERLRVQGTVRMDSGFTASGNFEKGTILLTGANIIGDLHFSSANIQNQAGPAIMAENLFVGGNLRANDHMILESENKEATGTIYICGSTVKGKLSFSGSNIVNTKGPAFVADRIIVESSVTLDEGFTVEGNSGLGAVRLSGARISGQLSFANAKIVNESGPAIIADRLTVESSTYLDNGFIASGSGVDGTVRLLGVTITGQLSMAGSKLTNLSGPALFADRICLDSDMYLDGHFRAIGRCTDGAIRLIGARIGGSLSFTDADIENTEGPAIIADRLSLTGSAYLDEKFKAEGQGEDGAVSLVAAVIGGELTCAGGHLVNNSGPALNADGIKVGGDILLNQRFSAIGYEHKGAVHLSDSIIGGRLDLSGGHLSNPNGPAFVANDMTVSVEANLNADYHVRADKKTQIVSLNGARIGAIELDQNVIDWTKKSGTWSIDGLTYSGCPTVDASSWIEFISCCTDDYAAQPYQQIASNMRASGHDRDARHALIAQRKDQLSRGNTNWRDKLWGVITFWTVGYGYRSWLPLIWILGVLATCAVYLLLISPEALMSTSAVIASGGDSKCTGWERFMVAIDISLPIINTGVSDVCVIARRTLHGDILAFILPLIKAVSWSLSALFVAGFTGIIRRS